MILYHYWRSSCSWRVRWAFALKSRVFRPIHVSLLEDQQKSPSYLKINPSGAVPCLQISEDPPVYLSESLAIIQWLDLTDAHHPLQPTDPLTRARAWELAYSLAANVQPLQNLATQKRHSCDPENQKSWAKFWILKGLAAYEKRLQDLWPGTFSLGAEPTVADLCLIPQCYNALRFGIPLEREFPILWRIYNHARDTPACQASSPEAWESHSKTEPSL